MSFIAELKRRNVFKVAAAYVVVSWLVLQVIDTIAEPLHLPEWVPSFFIVLLAVGFLVALFLAWAYELTPEGVKKAEEVDKEASITHQTGQKINTLIIVCLVIASGYFFWESRLADTQARGPTETVVAASPEAEKIVPSQDASSPASIAVLPFADLSPGKDQEYFTDGISEELLNLLAGVKGLNVTSRTSAFSFKGSKKKVSEIARELKVAHILEGSIRKAGDTIRITAQLIRTEDDVHLWSSTYDRKLENIFAIQDEIAGAIVDALMPHLGLQAKPKIKSLQTTNPEAHRLTLLARHLMHSKRNEAGLRQAIEYLEQALAEDEHYAPAHAAMAECWVLLPGYAELSLTEAHTNAMPHLERALELDSGLASAYAVYGLYYMNLGQEDKALESFDQAMELNPSYSEVKTWKANLLDDQLKLREALALRREVVVQDPLFVLGLSNLMATLSEFGMFDEVEALLPSLGELSVERHERAVAFLNYGRGDYRALLVSALNNLGRVGTSPGLRAGIANIFTLFGLTHEAQAIASGYFSAEFNLAIANEEYKTAENLFAKQVLDDPDNNWLLTNHAHLYFLTGENAKACRIYDRAWKQVNSIEAWRRFFVNNMLYYSLCSRIQGDSEKADKLLTYARRQVDAMKSQGVYPPTYFTQEYSLLLAEGRIDEALALYSEALNNGFGYVELKLITRILAPQVQGLPAFTELLQKQRDIFHAFGREFLQKVCKDNPWKDYWQPVEGSCEKAGVGA